VYLATAGSGGGSALEADKLAEKMKNILGNSNFGFTKWFVALVAALMTFATTGWGQTAQSLPYSYSSGRTNMTSANGWSYTGIGTDYADATAPIKFDDQADVATLKIAASPNQVSFNLKGNSFSGGTFTLSQSPDGTTFTAVSTYTTTITASSVKFTQNLLSSTRYIRWIYTTKSSGNVGLGAIAITASAAPAITGAATAMAFTTTYGTASEAQSFAVSGSNLTANLVATAPTGFEVSADGTTYGSIVTFTQTGGSASGTLRARLAANATVNGTYNSQNIELSSTGATAVNIVTASTGNSVTAKGLTITGLTAQNKNWDNTTTASVTGTAAFSGLISDDSSLTPGGSVTWAFADANVGTNKTLNRTGSYTVSSSNYSLTQPTLTASIAAVAPSAPTITGITAGNGQLSVAFTPPTSSGGVSITDYKYSLDGGALVSVGSTSSPLIITGLINGQSYAVELCAVNSAGDSLASSAVNGTPQRPSSPTITVAPATFGSAFNTTYGATSSTQTFRVSGSALNNDLTVTAPTGFEVSRFPESGYADSLNLTSTSGSVASTTIYTRLKATAAAGSYNDLTFTIVSTGAPTQNVVTTLSGNVVGQAALTITGIGIANKVYDRTTTATISGSATYEGLQNGESFSVTGAPSVSFATATVGLAKPVTVTGYTAPNSNYSLTQPTLAADISAVALTVSGATVTSKSYDGTTAATITGATLNGVIKPDVVILTGETSGTFVGVNVGTGIAVSTTLGITGADAGNYSLTAPTGLVGEITKATAVITFNTLPSGKKVGDTAFSAGATTSVGTLSYYSSNPNVATVDGSGKITPVAPGVTTITANVAGTANYNAAAPASQTLNVAGAAAASGLIAGWDFQTITPRGTAASAAPNSPLSYTANFGSGTIYLDGSNGSSIWTSLLSNPEVTAFAGTAVNAGAGFSTTTTSPACLALANSSANSKKVAFKFSMSGLKDLVVSYASQGTGTGFSTHSWETSVDGTNWLPAQSITSVPSAFATTTLTTIASLNNSATAYLRLTVTGASSASGNNRLDNIQLNATGISTPTIAAPNGTFSVLSTTYGTASAASATTVTVTGGSLTANITATAPMGFEVSNDGATYGATANFAQTNGFANGTLYLRLAANAPVGSNSGNVVLSSTGATPVNVATATSTVTNSAGNPLQAYLANFGLSGTDAAGTADPDGDGMDNNAEFAFGTSPVSGASRAVTQESVVGGIKIKWLQRSGINYTVKSTDNLGSTFSGTVSSSPVSPQPGGLGDYQQYEATLTGGDRGFLKVEAIVP